MQPTLTTTAQMLHDLGLAAGFGGTLFGRMALAPAVRAVSDPSQRGRVIDEAWSRYKWVNAASLGAAGLSWIIGRTMISGRSLGKDARGAVIAKDVLVGLGVATTVANIAIGTYLGEGSRGYLPIEDGNTPSSQTPPNKALAMKTIKVLGIVNLVATAGVIAVTTFLNQKAASSHRWTALSRFLP